MNTYVPWNPCRRGHYERYKSTGACVECQKMHSSNRSRKGSPGYRYDNPVTMAKQQALYNMRIKHRRLGNKWDDVLTWIYLDRPEGYVIDHIEPLDATDRSGLHTPWNLQYVSSSDNNYKKSKVGYICESAIEIDWRKYENKPLP